VWLSGRSCFSGLMVREKRKSVKGRKGVMKARGLIGAQAKQKEIGA